MRLSLRLELLGKVVSVEVGDPETTAETPTISDVPQPMAVYAEMPETTLGFQHPRAVDKRYDLRARGE